MGESRLWREIERDLRRAPVVDASAAADRVMTAVRNATSEMPGWQQRLMAIRDWLTSPSIALTPAHVLAVLVVVIAAGAAVLARPLTVRNGDTTTAIASAPTPAAIATVVSDQPAADGTHEVRFRFVVRSATRVAVAGDFNDWNPTATPLQPTGDGNVWSAVVRVRPGRHQYAFVVDDSVWVIDATAPRAPETEFGGESSVLFVSRRS
ncbi:MAG TPA: isoamylase early set domain-containing protein [Gemmatimonadaceae bacterium]|jgi:hypothetical protein|nr:isoamylase early set domain-containing protein [Gemmatimonadaceae bacterium]